MTEFACCAGSRWSAVTDLGSAESFDFILGTCDGCGRYWMNVWSPVAPLARYLPVGNDVAERLSAIPAGTARNRALATWFDAQ